MQAQQLLVDLTDLWHCLVEAVLVDLLDAFADLLQGLMERLHAYGVTFKARWWLHNTTITL